VAQVIMALWRAGEVAEGGGHRDTSLGRIFINNEMEVTDGDWVIITQEDRHGIRVQRSAVAFTKNYKVVDALEKLLVDFPDLKPFVHRLFYGRVAEGIQRPDTQGRYSLRVNGFEGGGHFFVNATESIPAGAVVEILKGSRGSSISVAKVDLEEEAKVFTFETYHDFLKAAMDRVHTLRPKVPKMVVGVLAFDISFKGRLGKFMEKGTVDVPGAEGRVADVYLIHLDEGPVKTGEAIQVWAEGNNKLFCQKTNQGVEQVFGEVQDIVNALEPKLVHRDPLCSPTNGVRLKR
jgi:hypothetical protein